MADPGDLECDVLIVGGGLVGSLLANALSRLPIDVVLVEARDVATLEQPSFDGRATALANGSRRVLEQLGLWTAMRPEAQPIRHIHIGERGRFGAARIEASEEGVRALGYTVENRVIGAALWQALAACRRFSCLAPARLIGCEHSGSAVTARIESNDDRQTVRARLLIAADGARSKLRQSLGITARVDEYRQNAVILNCTTSEPHAARAFERFTPDGPLAVLPLTRNRVAVVWTLPESAAGRLRDVGDAEFRSALQQAFGYRLGRFDRIGRRDQHVLARVQSAELVRQRIVLIGNAAVALHPVAGQGFNLALRDVAALAELIAEQLHAGSADVGSPAMLERYRVWRREDQRKLAHFTHALVQGFGASLPGLSLARSAGLLAFDMAPGAKSMLARHTMGLAGRVPRLARHLDLT